MSPQMIRRSVLALAAAGAVSASPAALAQSDEEEVERIVVTAPRSAMFRPSLVVIDGIREHVVDCLNQTTELPRGAPEVSFRVRFNADGTLDGPPAAMPEPTGLEADDRYMRAVVAARRALYHCEPYDFLPPGEYRHWEELILVFRSPR
ncbi:MAG: hypothetical protein GWO02_10145 [Gammaproteobacteria bacterium]|nr:hypothetical protein [Gammaproteobacteria bacterium]